MRRVLKVLNGLIVTGAAAVMALPVHAQDPEPTQTPIPTMTPTPLHLQAVQLSSGNTLVIDRTITYGDIAIVVALLMILAFLVILVAMQLPRKYL